MKKIIKTGKFTNKFFIDQTPPPTLSAPTPPPPEPPKKPKKYSPNVRMASTKKNVS